jgi:serine/threonine-protein kinase
VTTSGLTGMAIDREQLKKVEAELARHIGPIAPVVIRNAAKTSATLEALCEMAGREINDEKVRAAFIAKFTAAEKSAPPSGRTGLAAAPSAEALESISRKFSPEALARAEKALAQHIGAIARVVVRRAAAKARDEAELYLLISDEIKDPVERKAFAKKAVSISTRL